MAIATIKSMRSTGSFVWKQGPAAGTTAYGHYIELSDGVMGGVNAKSESPPYKPGDSVEYSITGQDGRGQNKLKVKKVDAMTGAQVAPSNSPANTPATQNNAISQQGGTIHPATAGCAFKEAVGCLLAAKDGGYSRTAMLDGTFSKDVHALASQFVRELYRLEHNMLAPKLGEAAAIAQGNAALQAAGFPPAKPVEEDGNPY